MNMTDQGTKPGQLSKYCNCWFDRRVQQPGISELDKRWTNKLEGISQTSQPTKIGT